MIIISHKGELLEHSGFPAVNVYSAKYGFRYDCSGFNDKTEYALFNTFGMLVDPSWWITVEDKGVWVRPLPEGWTLRIRNMD